mmetsp:Transcript_25736/g.85779  ORF Transcript_25736/g.85779 Transcript_25736/m.85779 type:complete len:278 (+) Transcript_25736:738-1571(+)
MSRVAVCVCGRREDLRQSVSVCGARSTSDVANAKGGYYMHMPTCVVHMRAHPLPGSTHMLAFSSDAPPSPRRVPVAWQIHTCAPPELARRAERTDGHLLRGQRHLPAGGLTDSPHAQRPVLANPGGDRVVVARVVLLAGAVVNTHGLAAQQVAAAVLGHHLRRLHPHQPLKLAAKRGEQPLAQRRGRRRERRRRLQRAGPSRLGLPTGRGRRLRSQQGRDRRRCRVQRHVLKHVHPDAEHRRLAAVVVEQHARQLLGRHAGPHVVGPLDQARGDAHQ